MVASSPALDALGPVDGPPPLPTRGQLEKLHFPNGREKSALFWDSGREKSAVRAATVAYPKPTRPVPDQTTAVDPRPRRILFQNNDKFAETVKEGWKGDQGHQSARNREPQEGWRDKQSHMQNSTGDDKTSWKKQSYQSQGDETAEAASSSWEAPKADAQEQNWSKSSWQEPDSTQARHRGRDIIRQYGGAVRDHSLMTGAVTREDSVDPEGDKPDRKGPPPRPWWTFKKVIPPTARPWNDPEEETSDVLSIGMPDEDPCSLFLVPGVHLACYTQVSLV